MNKRNIKRLIKRIQVTEHYDQYMLGIDTNGNHFTSMEPLKECQTPCCLAGHAAFLALEDTQAEGRVDRAVNLMEGSVWRAATDFLELTGHQAKELFQATPLRRRTTTKDQAIRTLKWLAKTGIVDWEGAQKWTKPTSHD